MKPRLAPVLALALLAPAGALKTCTPGKHSKDCFVSENAVETESGPVVGTEQHVTDAFLVQVSTFWGIPFAQAPVGDLRFQAPQPVKEKWTTPLDATKPKPSCMQMPGLIDQPANATVGQEDCLYLNVFTQTSYVGSDIRKPVIVWIYGGAYEMGDSCTQVPIPQLGGICMYDGAELVALHGIVMASINYRLSGLGFWAADGLEAEDADGSTGNMGQLDQRAGMAWVQRNIERFGGDSKKVTLIGESAGAFSIFWHLASKPSWPYFQQAVLQSGTGWLSWFFQPKVLSKEMYRQWAAKVGCSGSGQDLIKCLRSVDPRLLMTPPAGMSVTPPVYGLSGIGPMMACGPTVDGTETGLQDVPIELIKAGNFNKVPVIIGSNKDDGDLFVRIMAAFVPGYTSDHAVSRADVENTLRWAMDDSLTAKIKDAYPEAEFTSKLDNGTEVVHHDKRISHIVRDGAFACGGAEVADVFAGHGVPVYRYVWSFDQNNLQKYLGPGDQHGSEILYLFHIFPRTVGVLGWNKAVEASDLLGCAWTKFVKTGTPNGAGNTDDPFCKALREYPEWPQYNASERWYYSLQVPPKPMPVRAANTWPDDEYPSEARCNAWKGASYPWRCNGGHDCPGGTVVV